MSKEAKAEQLSKIVFGKSSKAAENIINNMVAPMLEMFEIPADQLQEKKNRIVEQILEISNRHSLKNGPLVLDKFYTEEQLDILIDFYVKNPWYNEISNEVSNYHMEIVQKETAPEMEQMMKKEFPYPEGEAA